MNVPDKFNFFCPAKITKAKDKEGKEIMKIGGIASTASVDADGEILDPAGFQLDYFLNSGYLNWHHQAKTDPTAIVGEPTKAEVTKDGLYIEGILYADSKTAQGIYSLAKTLEKNKSTRRLGFSIEGKVLERDPLDETKILSAQITGVAITPTPKNPNTLLNIIKGLYVDDDDQESQAVSQPANPANGGTTYILNMELPNGDKLYVTKDCQVKVVKATTTESAAAIMPEHVDGKEKNLMQKLPIQKSSSTFRNLSEEEVYSFIFTKIGANDLEKAHMIYKLIQNIPQTDTIMAESKVTIEQIEKAFGVLGIEISDDDFVKAGDAEKNAMQNAINSKKGNSKASEKDNETSNSKGDAETQQKENLVKKGEDEEEESEDDAEKGKKADVGDDDDDIQKMKGMQKALNEAMSKADYSNKEDVEKIEKMKKSMDSHYTAMTVKLQGSSQNGGATTSVENQVQKALASQELMFTDKLNAIEKANTEQNKALGSLIKATLDQLGSLEQSNVALTERLTTIEDQPNPPKSKGIQYLKKAFEAAKVDGKRPLSPSVNKPEILTMLDNLAGTGANYNKEMGNACMQFEQSNVLTKATIDDLEKSFDIKIIQ